MGTLFGYTCKFPVGNVDYLSTCKGKVLVVKNKQQQNNEKYFHVPHVRWAQDAYTHKHDYMDGYNIRHELMELTWTYGTEYIMMRINITITCCFMPSKPGQLYQGKTLP